MVETKVEEKLTKESCPEYERLLAEYEAVRTQQTRLALGGAPHLEVLEHLEAEECDWLLRLKEHTAVHGCHRPRFEP